MNKMYVVKSEEYNSYYTGNNLEWESISVLNSCHFTGNINEAMIFDNENEAYEAIKSWGSEAYVPYLTIIKIYNKG